MFCLYRLTELELSSLNCSPSSAHLFQKPNSPSLDSLAMVKFCDLPLEILLDIIDRATESTKDPPPSHPHGDDSIRCLSLVCSYLNGVTARKLFRTYRLQLREKDSDDDSAEGAEGAGAPTCFLTGRSLLELHPDGVEARLGHLRKKAAFVRELRIVDYGQPAVYRTGSSAAYLKERDGPPPAAPFDLPPLVVRPALIETLDTLDRVVSVVFETTDMSRPPARLPDELWGWLSRCKPRKVSFDGYFAFPDPLGWLPPVVGSMSLVMNEEASRVLEVRVAEVALSRSCRFFGRNTADRSVGRAPGAPRHQGRHRGSIRKHVQRDFRAVSHFGTVGHTVPIL